MVLTTALIPVRIGPGAKGRLAHVLGPAERARLVSSLFEHVAGVLLDTGWLRVVALSPEHLDADVEVWTDEAPGLNGAVGAAIARAGLPVLVVHADLPLLAVRDVEKLLDEPGDVIVARAHDGGTNGLLLRSAMPLAFGPDSALVHARQARRAGLVARVVDIPGFARDVDDETGLSLVRSARTRP